MKVELIQIAVVRRWLDQPLFLVVAGAGAEGVDDTDDNEDDLSLFCGLIWKLVGLDGEKLFWMSLHCSEERSVSRHHAFTRSTRSVANEKRFPVLFI